MSTSNNKKGVIVGLFVFFGIAILIVGVLTLGGQKKSFVKALHIDAVFKDVNGLAPGNNIWFSGVKVGTIKDISFAPDANVVVRMSVEEKVRRYIHQDAKVKISSDGLIGNKIIVIFGGSSAAPTIVEGSRLQVEAALNPEEMLSTLQANNQNLLAITGDLKTLTQGIASGKGSIGQLLTNETLFNDLKAVSANLKQTTTSANAIAGDLSAYTEKLTRKGSLADDLATDTVIFTRLKATMAQINDAAAKANGIVDQFSSTMSQLNNPNTPVGVLLNDPAAAANLKATLENLQSGTSKLDENMEALQHNFLFRGYFRRKAKQEKK